MAKSPRNVTRSEPAKGENSASSRSPAGGSGNSYVIADGEELNLHNRYLAAFLAWLLPGAGHYYQGRTFKAGIYFASIVACIAIGLWLSAGRCVYASWNDGEKRWQFGLQAGVGLQAIPAGFQAWRISKGNEPFFQGWIFDKRDPAPFAPPEANWRLDQWHKETASGFELGTLYTMIAGLLNILAVFDAFNGPLPPPTAQRKKPNEGDALEGETSDKTTSQGT